MTRKMKLVVVEWLDSHQGRGWEDVEDLEEKVEPLSCRSVGWVLKETDEALMLVPHIAGQQSTKIIVQGTGDLVIPKCAISKIKTIGVWKL